MKHLLLIPALLTATPAIAGECVSQKKRIATHGLSVAEKVITHKCSTDGRCVEANPVVKGIWGEKLSAVDTAQAIVGSAVFYELGLAASKKFGGCKAVKRYQNIALIFNGGVAIYMTVRFGF